MRRRWRLLPDDPDIGWVPYVWLVYLSFLFAIPIAFAPEVPAGVHVASIAATAVFLPLYFSAYWVQGGARLLLALAMSGVGASLAAINPAGNTFFIFAAYFAGMASTRPPIGIAAVGLVGGTLALAVAFIDSSPYFWVPAAIGIVIVGLLGVQQVQRDRAHASLRLAREEIDALARIAERERIARDLHDLLGQSLSIVALKAELAEKLAARDPGRAAKEMADIHRVAREALGEVRTAVRGYRVGNGAGLRQEIGRARDALAAADVELSCDDGPETIDAPLDAMHEGVLALVLREATTNVIRHAAARRCEVRFFRDDAAFGVEVRDDGRGPTTRPGQGLLGMRERVEAIGGRLVIDPAQPGTRIVARFPVAISQGAP